MTKNTKVTEVEAKDVETGRDSKRIGIEIEFFGVEVNKAIQEIRRAGVEVADYNGYTHETIPQWKITYDASVTSAGTGVGNGLELVSPPLTINDMKDQLQKALGALNELGAKVDVTCGVHVHHEIDDMNVDHVKNIYRIYKKHENHINELMPKSRRQDPGASGFCRGLGEFNMNRIEAAHTLRDIEYAQDTRYRVINFASYVKYGTIEFRQHSGSTDFEKLYNWILITQAIVAAAKKKKTIKPLSASAKKRETEAFNREVGLEYTKQGLYSRDRKAKLKKAYNKIEQVRAGA